jgi:hypothetical protein
MEIGDVPDLPLQFRAEQVSSAKLDGVKPPCQPLLSLECSLPRSATLSPRLHMTAIQRGFTLAIAVFISRASWS